MKINWFGKGNVSCFKNYLLFVAKSIAVCQRLLIITWFTEKNIRVLKTPVKFEHSYERRKNVFLFLSPIQLLGFCNNIPLGRRWGNGTISPLLQFICDKKWKLFLFQIKSLKQTKRTLLVSGHRQVFPCCFFFPRGPNQLAPEALAEPLLCSMTATGHLLQASTTPRQSTWIQFFSSRIGLIAVCL